MSTPFSKVKRESVLLKNLKYLTIVVTDLRKTHVYY